MQPRTDFVLQHFWEHYMGFLFLFLRLYNTSCSTICGCPPRRTDPCVVHPPQGSLRPGHPNLLKSRGANAGNNKHFFIFHILVYQSQRNTRISVYDVKRCPVKTQIAVAKRTLITNKIKNCTNASISNLAGKTEDQRLELLKQLHPS